MCILNAGLNGFHISYVKMISAFSREGGGEMISAFSREGGGGY